MGLPNRQAPGNYPGAGQAYLLNMNHQYALWYQARVAQGTASVAVQLSRISGAAYPFGAGFQVAFSGDPGTFEIDIQGAEDDTDADYVTIATITQVNGSFVGRVSIDDAQYPKFVRGYIASLTNDVNTSLLATR